MKVKYPKIDLSARCHWETLPQIIRAFYARRGAHWLAQLSRDAQGGD